MKRLIAPFALLSLAVVVSPTFLTSVEAGKYRYPPNDDKAVELANVQSLIFKQNAMTTGKRTSPVSQLTCVGGGACGTDGEPQVVHCSNIGIDYANGDPTWKCTAELENGLRLGTTDVVCEGFRDRDDPWILRGSCGLEYTLVGSPVTQQAQAQGSSAYASNSYQHASYKHASKPHSASAVPSSSRRTWANWLVGGFLV
jgi:hypothetical protein